MPKPVYRNKRASFGQHVYRYAIAHAAAHGIRAVGDQVLIGEPVIFNKGFVDRNRGLWEWWIKETPYSAQDEGAAFIASPYLAGGTAHMSPDGREVTVRLTWPASQPA